MSRTNKERKTSISPSACFRRNKLLRDQKKANAVLFYLVREHGAVDNPAHSLTSLGDDWTKMPAPPPSPRR